jgi:hypothetical protein
MFYNAAYITQNKLAHLTQPALYIDTECAVNPKTNVIIGKFFFIIKSNNTHVINKTERYDTLLTIL